MPKASDYSKGFIYKFVCNDINVLSTYTGSSTDWVKRKSNHKTCCNVEGNDKYNLHIYQVMRANNGWDNWTMLKICDFPCDSKFELEVEERRHMELLGSDMNKAIPTRTIKEYNDSHKDEQKKYYQINKASIDKKNRNYAINHKEEIVQYKKEYYLSNEDKNSTKRQEYRDSHKEEKKLTDKQYRKDNRDEINARQRELRKEINQQAKLDVVIVV